MKPTFEHLARFVQNQHLSRQDLQMYGGVVAALAVVAGASYWYSISHRIPVEEIERRRREDLALNGRITDGLILDARTLGNEDSVSPTPEVLVYSYSVAGMTYNCAQDVSSLPDRVAGFRIDQPVQVKYDPRNPGNSILVAESWSGLWLRVSTLHAAALSPEQPHPA